LSENKLFIFTTLDHNNRDVKRLRDRLENGVIHESSSFIEWAADNSVELSPWQENFIDWMLKREGG